jgi:integrase
MASVFQTENGWRAQVRRAGAPARSRYFKTKQEALRWARAEEHRLDTHKAPDGLRITIADIVDAFEGSKRARALGKSKLWFFAKHKAELGHLRLDEITRVTLLSYVTKRENEGAGPATILNDLSYFGAMLKVGGAMLDAQEAVAAAVVRLDAVRGLLSHAGRLSSSTKRDRRPTVKELEALEKVFAASRINTPMFDLILFAIATAMRLGEIVGVTWEDFDAERHTIVIRDRKDPRNKAGNNQRVPLLRGHFTWRGQVVDPVAIMMRQPGRTGRVFPFVADTVTSTFWKFARKAGVEGLRFHDLRHDAISRLFEAGYQIPEVALVSGHKTWENLRRYTQLDPASIQKVTVKS